MNPYMATRRDARGSWLPAIKKYMGRAKGKVALLIKNRMFRAARSFAPPTVKSRVYTRAFYSSLRRDNISS